MNNEIKDRLDKYLQSRYLNDNNYYIESLSNKILFKICYTEQTNQGINNIIPVKSHFFVSDKSYSYKLGFRLGIAVRE